MTPAPLSSRLRAATEQSHRTAEESPWARALATGRLDRASYAAHLAALGPVYAALEQEVAAHRDDPAVAAVHHPGLVRAPALAQDVAHWGRATPPPTVSDAAQAYAARIRRAAGLDPALLVGHHYVRYLGDLSGGQVVAAALGRRGTAFYDFADVAEPTERGGTSTVPFVRRYRERLDALPVSPARADAVVAEAVASFAATTAVFDALAALLPEATAAVPGTRGP